MCLYGDEAGLEKERSLIKYGVHVLGRHRYTLRALKHFVHKECIRDMIKPHAHTQPASNAFLPTSCMPILLGNQESTLDAGHSPFS